MPLASVSLLSELGNRALECVFGGVVVKINRPYCSLIFIFILINCFPESSIPRSVMLRVLFSFWLIPARFE